MRILVLYYSRTGHTRTVARALAGALGARLLEIACRRYEGWTGPLAMAWDIFTRNRPAVTVPGLEDEDFDLTLVGGPVWAARPAPPVVSLLASMSSRSALCLFLTCNGTSPKSPADAAMAEMVTASPGRVAATGIFKEATIASDALPGAVDDFARAHSADRADSGARSLTCEGRGRVAYVSADSPGALCLPGGRDYGFGASRKARAATLGRPSAKMV